MIQSSLYIISNFIPTNQKPQQYSDVMQNEVQLISLKAASSKVAHATLRRLVDEHLDGDGGHGVIHAGDSVCVGRHPNFFTISGVQQSGRHKAAVGSAVSEFLLPCFTVEALADRHVGPADFRSCGRHHLCFCC